MSNAAPMNTAYRMISYLDGRNDFTPAQKRRARKKANHHARKQARSATRYFMKG